MSANSISGSFWSQFTSTIFSLDCGPHYLISSLNCESFYCFSHFCNFSLCIGHCGWYGVESLDSIFLWNCFLAGLNCLSYGRTLLSSFSFLAICFCQVPKSLCRFIVWGQPGTCQNLYADFGVPPPVVHFVCDVLPHVLVPLEALNSVLFSNQFHYSFLPEF